MRAIVYSEYGTPDVLRVEEVAKPIPKDDEVLIRVRAVESTKADCELRSFRFPVKWFWLPLRIAMGIKRPKRQILGSYFSGVVNACGKDVSRFKPGDSVFGCAQMRLGAYGEYLSLPSNYTIAPMPSNASFEEAAAVLLGGLNALHFMRKAKIRPNERVLINGAGGSIGIFGAQIAKSMGAEVIAVDSGIKEEMLRGIGIDHFIDYTKEDFSESGQTYDVIFDMVARSSYSKCMTSLKPQGRYLTANPRVSTMFRSYLTSVFTKRSATFAFAGEKEEELLAVKEMIEEGKIRPVVDRIFPIEQAAEAHRLVETEQRLGSIVISFGE